MDKKEKHVKSINTFTTTLGRHNSTYEARKFFSSSARKTITMDCAVTDALASNLTLEENRSHLDKLLRADVSVAPDCQ